MDVEIRTVPGFEALVVSRTSHSDIAAGSEVGVPVVAVIFKVRVLNHECQVSSVLWVILHIAISIPEPVEEWLQLVIVHRHGSEGSLGFSHHGKHRLAGLVGKAAAVGQRLCLLQRIAETLPHAGVVPPGLVGLFQRLDTGFHLIVGSSRTQCLKGRLIAFLDHWRCLLTELPGLAVDQHMVAPQLGSLVASAIVGETEIVEDAPIVANHHPRLVDADGQLVFVKADHQSVVVQVKLMHVVLGCHQVQRHILRHTIFSVAVRHLRALVLLFLLCTLEDTLQMYFIESVFSESKQRGRIIYIISVAVMCISIVDGPRTVEGFHTYGIDAMRQAAHRLVGTIGLAQVLGVVLAAQCSKSLAFPACLHVTIVETGVHQLEGHVEWILNACLGNLLVGLCPHLMTA